MIKVTHSYCALSREMPAHSLKVFTYQMKAASSELRVVDKPISAYSTINLFPVNASVVHHVPFLRMTDTQTSWQMLHGWLSNSVMNCPHLHRLSDVKNNICNGTT